MQSGLICTVLMLVNLSFLSPSMAQPSSNDDIKKHRVAILTGYGDQTSLDVTYNYQIIFLQFEYIKTISQKNGWSFELISQPQINFTSFDRFEEDAENEHSIEVGTNTGLAVRKSTNSNKMQVYFIISSGPLYVPDTPARQSSGLNFSSSLNLGINIELSKHLYLDIRPGVRHLSNARLRIPNRGLNNVTAITGLSFYLD